MPSVFLGLEPLFEMVRVEHDAQSEVMSWLVWGNTVVFKGHFEMKEGQG